MIGLDKQKEQVALVFSFEIFLYQFELLAKEQLGALLE
jgi:hypothetical protein